MNLAVVFPIRALIFLRGVWVSPLRICLGSKLDDRLLVIVQVGAFNNLKGGDNLVITTWSPKLDLCCFKVCVFDWGLWASKRRLDLDPHELNSLIGNLVFWDQYILLGRIHCHYFFLAWIRLWLCWDLCRVKSPSVFHLVLVNFSHRVTEVLAFLFVWCVHHDVGLMHLGLDVDWGLYDVKFNCCGVVFVATMLSYSRNWLGYLVSSWLSYGNFFPRVMGNVGWLIFSRGVSLILGLLWISVVVDFWCRLDLGALNWFWFSS